VGDGFPFAFVAIAVVALAGCGDADRAPSTSTSTSAPSFTVPGGSGVQGTVSAGPTCPVERADAPCPPQLVAATVRATNGSGEEIATTESGSDGRYFIALPPGRYVLAATTGSAYPYCDPTEIEVPPARNIVADISCDTGIR
jgi:hypothetical protein